MMNMEFVDTDYSVLLDYPSHSNETDGKSVENPHGSEHTTGGAARSDEEKAKWTFAYCQQFFDVTTEEVLNRIWRSIKPQASADFVTEVLQNRPDLYGPIWISITVALELGLTSDMAHYMELNVVRPWRSCVNTLYRASVMLFLYSWCLPALICIALEWNKVSEEKFKLTELFCIYGYSSSIFLPTLALWILPIPWVRWISLFTATFLSGLLICRSLKKGLLKLERYEYYAIQSLLFVLNTLIGISFNVLFFSFDYEPVYTTFLPPASLINESINDQETEYPILIANLTSIQFNHTNTSHV